MFHFILLLLSELIEPSKFSPIVGGDVVESDGFVKYPFMVSLQQRISEQNNNSEYTYKHICGGSLLNTKWILTAGHCLWNKYINNVSAVIGHENINLVLEEHRLAIARVEYCFFMPATLQNDIALVRLKEPYNPGGFNFERKNLFGRLPNYGMKAYRKEACKIIGFGARKYAGVIQEQLNEGDVFVLSNKKCRLLLSHVWAPQKGDKTVCALGHSQDSCQGDSGGPLLCYYNETLYIYGIISYGLICGLNGVPGVYTMTGPYLEWIKLTINK